MPTKTPRWVRQPDELLSPAGREALAERKRRLLAAATAVLSQDGPNAPVGAIARQAGMGLSSFYRTFADKDELLDALAAERLASTADIWARALSRDDAVEAFADALHEVCSIWANDALLAGILRGRAATSAQLAAAAAERTAAVERLLDRAKTQGRMKADVTRDDVRATISAISALACGPSGTGTSWRRVLEFAIAGMRATREPSP
jgi:AcrR family transcriptional regulator